MQVFGFCDVEESTEGQHIKLVKLVYKKDRFITVVFMYAVNERITGGSLQKKTESFSVWAKQL